MSFKRKNPGNQSIRRQLTFYMGPFCGAAVVPGFDASEFLSSESYHGK